MTSQLIVPENAPVCSVSGFFALLLALAYPRFDSPCQIMYAKGVFSIYKITAALANLCISVHYGKLNLMLPSASKSQKITGG